MEATAEDMKFRSRSTTIVNPGWRAVFARKEDAEKELAYLNSNKNTMTYSEQRQREDKNNAKVFGIA